MSWIVVLAIGFTGVQIAVALVIAAIALVKGT